MLTFSELTSNHLPMSFCLCRSFKFAVVVYYSLGIHLSLILLLLSIVFFLDALHYDFVMAAIRLETEGRVFTCWLEMPGTRLIQHSEAFFFLEINCDI